MPADPEISHRFARRRAALVRAAAEQGADAVLVFGFGDALGAGTQSHGALRYLTGCNSHEAQSLLILTGDAAHLLISSPFVYPCTDVLGPQVTCEQVPAIALGAGDCSPDRDGPPPWLLGVWRNAAIGHGFGSAGTARGRVDFAG